MKWDVVVLGAGIAGLSAAYEFGKKGKKVLVLEKSPEAGGALHATKVKSFYVDDFYHHIFPRDKLTIKMCEELNVKIDWGYITTAFFENKKFYRLTKPQDLLFFKPLSFKNKAALARLMLKIKLIHEKDYPDYDDVSAKDFLIKFSNEETYKKFFEPLLVSKFGGDLARISAAWMIERIKLRSDRNLKGEKLGYIRGGFQVLTGAVVNAIEKQGGKVELNSAVKNVKMGKAGVRVKYNGKEIEAETLISTLPPRILLQFVKLPKEYYKKLESLEYQGACCVLVGLDKPLTPHYWTNILGKADFGAVIEQTNFVSPSNYEGDHFVYLASYPDKKSKIWQMSESEVGSAYLDDMHRIFGQQNVRWHKVFRLPAAGLIYHMGILENIVPVNTPISNLFVAGMFNSYPERSIDKSVAFAKEIVKQTIFSKR
jgi:protoporphyrinogen oxidase